jgi:diguanylate cyclase (GGDEF)-like protein
MMPGLNGFEVVKAVRETHSPDELPVIMVTARAENSDIVEALRLGANDYVTKPIDFSIAFARVQTALASKRAQAELKRTVDQLQATNRVLENEITERKRSEAQVQHMAHHDTLTGFGNRVLFQEQLLQALQRRARQGGSLAVHFLDIDDFKLVNDTLGHDIGDQLLTSVGERLRQVTRETDHIARVGSDEFAIIQTGLQTPDQAARMAKRITEAIAAPYDIGGHRITRECCIGIALAPHDGDSADQLLANANLALNRAKAEGRAKWRYFEAEMNERARARQSLEADLRKALAAGQFEIFYQPLFDLAADAISGFEALLRWRHPERGTISPAEFIPLAEEIGLIVPLGEWVLRQACTEAARWPDHIKLAVNISPVQFRSRALTQIVMSAISAAGLVANRLELEITETLLMHDNESTLAALHELRSMGVRISMDDFGTGYSSLNYLRRFPFDKLKIDQSFIRDIAGQGTTAIVRTIIALAETLGMVTTAEGVETRQQLEWLKAEGCTEIQGYLISRPLPASELATLIKAGRPVTRVA